MSINNAWMPVGDLPVEFDIEGVRRFQWLRNKEGRQAFGSRTLILPLYEALYEQHVFPRLTRDYRARFPTLKLFLQRWPEDTHAEFLSSEGRWDWRMTTVGPPSRLLPREFRCFFAEEVKNFESEDAISWGMKADSELYPPDVVPEVWQ